MKQSKFLVLCLIAAFSLCLHTAAGQVINATMQSGSSRVVTSRAAPVAKPVANTAIAPHVFPRPASFSSRTISSYAPRMTGQPGTNLQRNYSPSVRTLNPTFAALRTQRSAPEQQPITLDPPTRQTELRTLAAMRDRRGFRTGNATLATINPQPHATAPDSVVRRELETQDPVENTAKTKSGNRNDRLSHADAFRRHWHEWHDRNWWHDHCDTIVFVSIGYYFLEGSYWYPAYGYDPLNSYYDYDGPIYTYGNLLPDEVIANVQTALQDAGYYFGAITGSLSLETRAALANFQRDYGLQITGAIDEATVQTLGLY